MLYEEMKYALDDEPRQALALMDAGEKDEDEVVGKKRKRKMSAYELFRIDFRAKLSGEHGRKIDVRETWANDAIRAAWGVVMITMIGFCMAFNINTRLS